MTRITPRPRTRYRLPRYPTKLQVNQRPALLAKHLPAAWAARKELAGAAALLMTAAMAAGSSCKPGRVNMQGKDLAGMVAPVYRHGGGSAAMGCVVVTSPVFLSEDEAREVIIQELARSGIHVDRQDVSMDSMEIDVCHETCVSGDKSLLIWPYTRCDSIRMDDDGEDTKWTYSGHLSREPLKVDGIDSAKKVAFEYVSGDDYILLRMLEPEAYCGEPEGVSRVYGYSLYNVAQGLSEHLRGTDQDYYVGIFYDPITLIKDDPYSRVRKYNNHLWREVEDLSGGNKTLRDLETNIEQKAHEYKTRSKRAESKRLLRLQVRDFANWLKAQGAI
jgi:hypothetical protein